jgi:ABC-type sugar transport system ATPase subunit
MTLGDRIVIMKDGHILQCDSPLKLYEEPADLFVAGFIGSPGMNFVKARVVDGKLEHPDFSLRLPASASSASGDVTLGLRPQVFNLGSQEGAVTVQTKLDVIEPLGSENFLFCRLDKSGEGVTIRTEAGQRFAIGDAITLSFAPDAAHVFDGQGAALYHPTIKH